MMEWVKKNIVLAILQLLTLSILAVVGYSFTSWRKEINDKVSKQELKLTVDPIKQDIEEIKQDGRDTRKYYLDEIRLLRQDLNLKVDKP